MECHKMAGSAFSAVAYWDDENATFGSAMISAHEILWNASAG
jgi:hypothetical protein